MAEEETQYGEDALKDVDSGDIKSGDEEGTPVHSPTTPEDEGGVGEGTGEGDAGDATRPGEGKA